VNVHQAVLILAFALAIVAVMREVSANKNGVATAIVAVGLFLLYGRL
jgi:hypothetical protein